MAEVAVRVLLVEDDEDDFVLTRDLLGEVEGTDYEVRWVPDFDAALRALREEAYDVCLVDYGLGERNGVEFAREANRAGTRVPIILLTGQGDRAVDVAAMEAGAADFLNKGQITPALLERAIRYSVQQKSNERQRLKLIEEQAANRAKDEFIAVLGHELRTPLNAILGWAQLLRAGNMDAPTVAQALETIERNARAQSQLIEDLMDVSRIRSGKVKLDVRRVELPALIEAAAESVRPAAEKKRVELVLDPGQNIPPVPGDPTRLQQVLLNLLGNAVKFTPAGGRVTLSLRPEGRHVRLAVSDTGSGIDPALLPFVFDRFRQGEATLTREHQGLGLGLAIVRQLVELHGGAVQAESAGAGQGATFTVTLPAEG